MKLGEAEEEESLSKEDEDMKFEQKNIFEPHTTAGTTEDVGPGKYELPPVFGVIYRPRSAKSSPNSPRSPPRTRPSSAH